jgi:hypothetical protein
VYLCCCLPFTELLRLEIQFWAVSKMPFTPLLLLLLSPREFKVAFAPTTDAEEEEEEEYLCGK